MSMLTTEARKNLASNQFAGPNRTYPVPDAKHAANAKARASQAVASGHMTMAEQKSIDAQANKVIARCHAGGGKC